MIKWGVYLRNFAILLDGPVLVQTNVGKTLLKTGRMTPVNSEQNVAFCIKNVMNDIFKLCYCFVGKKLHI